MADVASVALAPVGGSPSYSSGKSAVAAVPGTTPRGYSSGKAAVAASGATTAHGESAFESIDLEVGEGAATVFYQMVAEDDNASGGVGQARPYYRTWVVQESPDLTASSYDGPYFGGAVNFVEIHVQNTWVE